MLRRLTSLALVVAFAASVAACRPVEQPTPGPTAAGSMKGYELYSWQDGASWRFSLLVGTNREKTLAEITDPSTAVTGIDGLRPELEKIPAGQFVSWFPRAGLPLPPDAVVTQVKQICAERGLLLTVGE